MQWIHSEHGLMKRESLHIKIKRNDSFINIPSASAVKYIFYGFLLTISPDLNADKGNKWQQS